MEGPACGGGSNIRGIGGRSMRIEPVSGRKSFGRTGSGGGGMEVPACGGGSNMRGLGGRSMRIELVSGLALLTGDFCARKGEAFEVNLERRGSSNADANFGAETRAVAAVRMAFSKPFDECMSFRFFMGLASCIMIPN